MTFGFSYIGLIFLIMLFVPNFFWIKNKPKDYEKYEVNESKLLLIFERLGEISVSITILIFSDFNINTISVWSVWIIISFLIMILYEFYWIKYFKSEKTMNDFYSNFLGIPVAGASLPVLAFFILGIYGKNLVLILSVIILGIGHIGIHFNHKNQIKSIFK